MNIEEFRNYCLSKPGVTEGFPFGPPTLVFKVMNKIFTITDVDNFESFNVKCDPELAVQLREEHEAVVPGWHMNKKHWNTIRLDGGLTNTLYREFIDHSYDLIVQSLPKKDQQLLKEL